MASTAIEQLRAERRAEREAAGFNTIIPQAQVGGVSEKQMTQDLANTSLGNRISQDVSGLAYGVPAAIATFATQSPLKTAKTIGEGLLQTGKDMLGVTGILGKKQQDESLTYYKAHPVLAALDVLSLASFGAGSVLKSALTTTARGATKAAVVTAAKEGVEASVVHAALSTSRSMFNVNKYIRGSTKAQGTLFREIEKAVRSGDMGGISETVRALLVKQGVGAESAVKIARATATDIANSLVTQSKRVKMLDTMTHPVGATFRGVKAGAGAVGAKLLGKASDSAVGKFFDEPLINANKKTATNLEQWLGAVVEERGWEQTTDNRFRILREIKEQGDFQGLTQEQFLKDFDNYVQADKSRAAIGLENEYVLVKNLPEHTANAMADTLQDTIKTIVDEVGETAGDAAARTVRVFDQISDFMKDNFGNAWTKYEERLRKAYGKTGNLNALDGAIRALSKNRPSVSFKKLNEAQMSLVNDIESFGYQVGYAPAKKVITQASDVIKDVADDAVRMADDVVRIQDGKVVAGAAKAADIAWETIESSRNKLGKVLDDFGFSAKGTIEGATEFVFARSMTQHLMGEFRKTFGNTITIKKPVVRHTTTGDVAGFTRVSIPVDRLYEWLNNHRQEFFDNRQGLKAARAYRPISVFDLNKKDLTNMGFDGAVAESIVSTAKKSLREVPASVTGLGEKLVNSLRAADGKFAAFGKFYDTFIKTALYMRYQSVLALPFQMQQFIETKIMASMITKDPRMLPGVQALAGFGKNMTMNRTLGILDRAKPYLQKITLEPDLADLTIARDIILPNTRRSLQDTIGGGEFGAIRKGVDMSEEGMQKLVSRRTESGASVLSSARVDAAWIQMWGGYAMKESARIGEAIANKFNLSLKEATAFTMENGNRVYQYPRIVREMQDAVQSTLHYKPGFQTSPLVKTMNIVLFPFRFQAKTLELTGQWLGSLDPVTRLTVLNNMSHFSNWVQTDDGKEWIRTKKNFLYSMLAYTTAWEQVGDGIDAVSRGQIFGGKAGLVGGVPFAFVFNFMQATGILPEDPEQYDARSGRPFRTREVPRELVSDNTALTALEEFTFMLFPGMPLYTITGGVIRGVGYRQLVEKALESGWGWAKAGITGQPVDRAEKIIERDRMKIGTDETRF